MDLAKNIIFLFVGIAVFLIGMTMMSSGLKKLAGKKVKNLFDKIANNRIAGLGIGAATTAVIQSSAATSVMAIGFINAGVMTIFQAVTIIMGAYIGTTVTGLLVSLSSVGGGFDISIAFMLLAFVGVVLTFFKNKIVKHIGEICCGLGLLFFGLFTLKEAFAYYEIKDALQNVFLNVSNPLLLLLIGALITMLVQSSSASTGIVIVMATAGAVNISAAIYVAIGATVGTVITTILATIGGSTNSKRTALIVFVMRIVMALLALTIIWPVNSSTNFLENAANSFSSPAWFISVFMVIYNVITMFLLLPFVQHFVTLSKKIIKDKSEQEKKQYIKFIDSKMLGSPSIALMQVKKEILNMHQLSHDNFKCGYNMMISQDFSKKQELIEIEDAIDYLNINITDFLISLSGKTEQDDMRIVGGLFHAINDIERIGDHAYNFYENALKMKDLGLKFSQTANNELQQMYEIILQMYDLTFDILNNPDSEKVSKLHSLEKQTDLLQTKLSDGHFERITKNLCQTELSPFYSTFVSELERVADHLTNIGYLYIHPTGDVE
ncbi:MAG: Na/Pi cotransporter family protein [Bacilli bacterium]|nr:Na/Pi cotransporter family protein [Bacilli bacterium]